MKNYIKDLPISIVPKLFTLFILFSISLPSCKKDDPVVPKTEPISALELSHHEFILFEHQKEEIYVTSGDATKASSSNEKVVRATLKGTTINISALSAGDAVISVTGSDKRELKIKIAVKSASEAMPEGVVVENSVLKTWPCDKIPDDGIAVIPISVKIIGKEAFKGCSFLKAVAIPMGLKTIEERAFLGCTNLSQPNLPTSIEKIEKGAFKDCSFNLSVSVTELKLYEKETGEIQVANYLVADVSTSDNSVAKAGFSDGKISIEAISKGECLIKLYDTALDSEKEIKIKVEAASDKVPDGAVIKDGVLTNWLCGKVPFHGQIEIPTTVKKLGNRSFAHCSTIKSIKIPDSVEEMGWEAFYQCNALKNVELSNSLKKIPQNAFRECTALESISIPDAVEEIGAVAFGYCKSLISVELGKNLKRIKHYAFVECINLKTVNIPNSVEIIEEETFKDCYALTSLTLGKNIKTIGEKAFEYCGSLESLIIPESVETISNEAFSYNEKLKTLVLNEGLREIGGKAFHRCGLDELILPASIKKIGYQAFADCLELKTVDFSKTKLENIPTWAFDGCSGLENVLFPINVKHIEERAFSGCSGMKEITIPASIISIGESAFYYCPELKKVVLKSQTPPSIKNNSFEFYHVKDLIFYVPAGTKDAYLNAEVWKDRLVPEKVVEL